MTTQGHLSGQDGRQPLGAFGAQGVHGVQILMGDLAVEEQEGTEGLVLYRGSDVFFDREVGEKAFDLGSAHLGRMAHVVEIDVALDPADVGLLGTVGIVFEADGITDLI